MRQNLKSGRFEVRRRRENALARLPKYKFDNSKMARKGVKEPEKWAAARDAEVTALEEILKLAR